MYPICIPIPIEWSFLRPNMWGIPCFWSFPQSDPAVWRTWSFNVGSSLHMNTTLRKKWKIMFCWLCFSTARSSSSACYIIACIVLSTTLNHTVVTCSSKTIFSASSVQATICIESKKSSSSFSVRQTKSQCFKLMMWRSKGKSCRLLKLDSEFMSTQISGEPNNVCMYEHIHT